MPLIADDKAVGSRRLGFIHRKRAIPQLRRVYAPPGRTQGRHRRCKVRDHIRTHTEECPHRAAQGARMIQVGTVVAEDQPVKAECRRAANDRAEVARIAHGRKQHQLLAPHRFGVVSFYFIYFSEIVKTFYDRDHAVRRFFIA